MNSELEDNLVKDMTAVWNLYSDVDLGLEAHLLRIVKMCVAPLLEKEKEIREDIICDISDVLDEYKNEYSG